LYKPSGWNRNTCSCGPNRTPAGKFRTLAGKFMTLAPPMRPLPENSGRWRDRCVRWQEILDVGAAVRCPVAGILDAAEGFESSLPGDPCPGYFASSSQGP